eukprot:Sspe_Gene.24430::Locus_9684_Transcript_1_1_Confidence_1.000_Length_4948::g.24430::m.24430
MSLSVVRIFIVIRNTAEDVGLVRVHRPVQRGFRCVDGGRRIAPSSPVGVHVDMRRCRSPVLSFGSAEHPPHTAEYTTALRHVFLKLSHFSAQPLVLCLETVDFILGVELEAQDVHLLPIQLLLKRLHLCLETVILLPKLPHVRLLHINEHLESGALRLLHQLLLCLLHFNLPHQRGPPSLLLVSDQQSHSLLRLHHSRALVLEEAGLFRLELEAGQLQDLVLGVPLLDRLLQPFGVLGELCYPRQLDSNHAVQPLRCRIGELVCPLCEHCVARRPFARLHLGELAAELFVLQPPLYNLDNGFPLVLPDVHEGPLHLHLDAAPPLPLLFPCPFPLKGVRGLQQFDSLPLQLPLLLPQLRHQLGLLLVVCCIVRSTCG